MRPNVLFIDAHDLGDRIAAYGYSGVRTPNFDRIAAEGVLLEQCFAASPICMPSRAACATSRYPHEVGITGQDPLDDDAKWMAHYFREAGYRTAKTGSLMVVNKSDWAGYDEDIRGERVETTCDYLKHHAESADQPFFLHVSFGKVHRPFGTQYDPELLDQQTIPPGMPQDDAITRLDFASLSHLTESLDTDIGNILDCLDQTGLTESTLVIYTSDHGIATARHKHTLYDGGLRVATMIRHPGHIPAGTRLTSLYSNMDLLPSLLSCCDIAIPDGLRGLDRSACWRGEAADTGRDQVVAEHTWGRRSGKWYYCPSRSIRTNTFKLIRNYFNGPAYVDNGYSSRFRHDPAILEEYFSDGLPERQLFDITTDPHELQNLADDPQYQDTLEALDQQLLAELTETKDPILNGFVPNKSAEQDFPQWLPTPSGGFHLNPDDPLDSNEDSFAVLGSTPSA